MTNDPFNGVWVFSENKMLALELLGKGRELANKLQQELNGVVIKTDSNAYAQTMIDYGADIVHIVDNPTLSQFAVELYAQSLAQLIEVNKPLIFLIGATKFGRELASRVAIKIQTGCVINCIKLALDSEKQLIMEREALGGRAIATEICQTNPKIVAVPLRTFAPCERKSRTGKIIEETIELGDPKSKLLEVKPKEAGAKSLEDAAIVVAGGRGIRNKEDTHLLEELATVLEGQVGWTRPVVEDFKWFPGTEWIGLSGQKIGPDLSILVGISGAIQYIAGIRAAKIIVAINNNPNAPVFEYADYGIVRDLYEFIPVLTEILKKRLSGDVQG